jgi:hypothetical protein
MTKTTALTFVAAVILMIACVAISLHGQRLVQSRMYEENERFIIYDRYDMMLESWEKAAGLAGLLSISTLIAGAMLWGREMQPRAQQPGSVLGLDGRDGRRIVGSAASWKSAVIAEIRVDESCTRLHEEENLTPLERLIRGY